MPVITDARTDVIKKSVESSLKRLQTDHIDIYRQHRQDANVPVEEVAGVMQQLIDAGKNSKFAAKIDYRSDMPQFTAEAMDKNQNLFALLEATAQSKNATKAQIKKTPARRTLNLLRRKSKPSTTRSTIWKCPLSTTARKSRRAEKFFWEEL